MENRYGIDKNKHYFVLMHPMENYGFVCLKSSNSPAMWVECEVVEDRYKVDDGYKVTLKALDRAYGEEHYYQCDFASLIKQGYIVPKDGETMHVEKVDFLEHLCGSAYIRHSGYELVS